jgi:hypothetical protein
MGTVLPGLTAKVQVGRLRAFGSWNASAKDRVEDEARYTGNCALRRVGASSAISLALSPNVDMRAAIAIGFGAA